METKITCMFVASFRGGILCACVEPESVVVTQTGLGEGMSDIIHS